MAAPGDTVERKLVRSLEAEIKSLRSTNALLQKHYKEAMQKVEKHGQKRHYLGRVLKDREEENEMLRSQVEEYRERVRELERQLKN